MLFFERALVHTASTWAVRNEKQELHTLKQILHMLYKTIQDPYKEASTK